MNAEHFINDIPSELANRAHSGTSFSPEARGQSERSGYASTLAADYESLAKHAPTEEKRAVLDNEFARYREGYKRRTLAYLHSQSRCVSSMIAGPSNFPVRRYQKRNDIAHKRLNELVDFRKRALDAITKTLHPEWRPIMSGDSDALARLQEKLTAAEARQARMKAVNAAIRRHAKGGVEAQVKAILEVSPCLGEAHARVMLKGDCLGRVGFADFELTNNGAEIRRLKARIETLSRNKATPETAQENENGLRLEDSPSDNRVRLFFPGKPDAAIRSRLKSSGFRWTPSLGCWQAYRNSRTLEIAAQFVAAPAA